MPHVAVTLHLPDDKEVLVRAPTNRHGQLPAVLVDPRGGDGQVIEGMWLGDSHDRRMDGTTYVAVQVRS